MRTQRNNSGLRFVAGVLIALLFLLFLSSSASHAQDAFSQKALNTIIGHLQQEILAGSNNTFLNTGTVSSMVSVPLVPATVMPALSGTLSGTLVTSSSPGFGNLVKYSAYGQPFYTGANYNLGSFPASNRASSASTGDVSQMGGFATAARWNRPLFLEKKSLGQSNDLTPAVSSFSPD